MARKGLVFIIIAVVVGMNTAAALASDSQATKFFSAIRDGKLASVRKCVDSNPSLLQVKRQGWTPMHCAVAYERLEVAEYLLSGGADPNVLSDEGTPTMMMAVNREDWDMLDLLILHGAKPETLYAESLFGTQPCLIRAANSGYKPSLEALRKITAQESLHNIGGWSLLRCNAIANSPEFVNLLLKERLIDAHGVDGRDLLKYTYSVAVLWLVVGYGGDPSYTGMSPFHIAALINNKDDMLRLLKDGVDIDSKLTQGWGYLLVDTLETRYDWGYKLRPGSTPLHAAALSNCADSADMLLAHGARLEAVDKSGYTPLHVASINGAAKVAAILLEHGANVNAKNLKGCTPIFYANTCLIGELLIKHGASVTDIGGELRDDFIQFVSESERAKIIKARTIRVNTEDEKGRTPLHHAALDRYAGWAKQLIEFGANVNAHDKWGWTPLHCVFEHQYTVSDGAQSLISTARVLLDHGADINARTGSDHDGDSDSSGGFMNYHIPAGSTVLKMEKLRQNNPDVLKFLKSRGARE